MDVKEFEKSIKHLDQEEVITISLSTIMAILVEKGFCTVDDLQNKFLEELKKRGEETNV